ncbi:SE1561 family protein [Bacillus amyloliquefaciens]|uniref:SE1561 family protein n=1 Tax=Bacillus amyloliquefaciens TaxID=1390 RepID=UPI0011B4464E|nr:SE1561 family protein [Bacillus amyloliquefaciens]
MGNAVNSKDQQLDYLKNRLDMFMNVIDSLDPESTDVEDIDRLIGMLDDLEAKYERFKKDWEYPPADAGVFLFP